MDADTRALLRTLLRSELFGLFTARGDRVEEASDAFLALAGLEAADLEAGLSAASLLPSGGDAPSLAEEVLASGAVPPRRRAQCVPDGAPRYVLVEARTISREERSWMGCVRNARDRSAHPIGPEEDAPLAPGQGPRALWRSDELLEIMFNNIHLHVAVLDRAFDFLRVNRAYARSVGHDPSFFEGRNHFDLFPDAENEAIFRQVVEEGAPYVVYEKPFRSPGAPEDAVMYWDWTLTPIRSSGGTVEGLVLALLEATDRVRNRMIMEEHLEKYRLVAENIRDVILTLDENLDLTFVSPSIVPLTGWTPADLLGRGPEAWLAAEAARLFRTLVEGRKDMLPSEGGRGWHQELEMRRRDGGTVWVELSFDFYFTGAGAGMGVLAAARDVTDRRSLQKQLLEAQKMEAVGQLAGGVAHDFNNMMQVILGCARRLEGELPAGSRRSEWTQQIRKAGERASHLTQQLLAFGRMQQLQPVLLDLNELLRSLEGMIRPGLPESIELALDLHPDPCPVSADPVIVEQVVMNLALNARDALDGPGRIVMSTGHLTFPSGEAPAQLAPGPYVFLSVADTGRGMDEKTLSRVFEPFFTTKKSGEGSGLGLSTVYGTVRQSGGTVEASSVPGRGSTFRVLLPRAPEPAEEGARRREKAEDPPAARGETVLLLEDDDMVRSFTAEELRDLGYEVVEASSSSEALEALRGREGRPDVLLSDVVLQGENGLQALEILRGEVPGLPVLFVSGHSRDYIREHGELRKGTAFLPKPFDAEQLASALRKVLDTGRP